MITLELAYKSLMDRIRKNGEIRVYMTWRHALKGKKPLQIVGVINAYVALMAEKAGYRALYLSGAGVSNFCYAVPDVGMTSMDNVAEEVRRIKSASSLPLLVDIDIGWFHVSRSVKEIERAGANAIHIEDQTIEKKCGHLSGKTIVSIPEMADRIKAAVDGRKDRETIIVARTDAYAVEGLEKTIERSQKYLEAGADMLFPEALTSLEEFALFRKRIQAPVLANITEFGNTPLLTTEQLHQAGIEMILYPLSCARAMNQAAWKVLQTIRKQGTQKECLNQMQTREELYQFLQYQPKEV